MAGETKTPERTASWIDKELQLMAKKIGSFEDKSIAQVIEEELWRVLPKRLKKLVDREYAELGEAGA